jgi:hypothetical protein
MRKIEARKNGCIAPGLGAGPATTTTADSYSRQHGLSLVREFDLGSSAGVEGLEGGG